jgi:hypothetical protein
VQNRTHARHSTNIPELIIESIEASRPQRAYKQLASCAGRQTLPKLLYVFACGNDRTEKTNLAVFCDEEPPTVYVPAAAAQLLGDDSTRYVDKQVAVPLL